MRMLCFIFFICYCLFVYLDLCEWRVGSVQSTPRLSPIFIDTIFNSSIHQFQEPRHSPIKITNIITHKYIDKHQQKRRLTHRIDSQSLEESVSFQPRLCPSF